MSERPPKFVSIPNPWPFESGTVRFRQPAGGVDLSYLERLRKGELGQPFILDDQGMRHLHFSLDSEQSSMDCAQPERLITAYTRKMMAFLLFKRYPGHIIMIGLGGGALAKFCYRHLPETAITVVEIDEHVIALRDEFHIPANDARFRVVHEDGAAFMARQDLRCDVVLIDAFDAAGIAPSLATLEFYRNAANALTENGLLVMNFFGVPERCMLNLEKLRAAFEDRLLLVPVQGGGNTLVFAFAGAPVPALSKDFECTAEQLQHEMALEFPKFLQRLRHSQPANSCGASRADAQ
jgi:spermidine synthase